MYIAANGDRYEGGYLDDMRHGDAVLGYGDGRRYEGQFVRDKRHGFGKMQMIPTADQGNPAKLFVGGKGSMYRFAEYVGEWRDDTREGHGIGTYADGRTHEPSRMCSRIVLKCFQERGTR